MVASLVKFSDERKAFSSTINSYVVAAEQSKLIPFVRVSPSKSAGIESLSDEAMDSLNDERSRGVLRPNKDFTAWIVTWSQNTLHPLSAELCSQVQGV